jgi:hypothetical protein
MASLNEGTHDRVAVTPLLLPTMPLTDRDRGKRLSDGSRHRFENLTGSCIQRKCADI